MSVSPQTAAIGTGQTLQFKRNGDEQADSTKFASATVNVVTPGQITAKANVQVGLYTISPAAAGQVHVQFGLDTTYVSDDLGVPGRECAGVYSTDDGRYDTKEWRGVIGAYRCGRNGSAGSRVGRGRQHSLGQPGVTRVLNPIKFPPHDLIISMRHQN